MSSNYTDNPSMDEILTRIKKALHEREERTRVETEVVSPQFSGNSKSLSFEEVREFSKSPAVSSKIVDNILNDDIFIKPVVGGGDGMILSKSQDGSGVFVLTKDMKISASNLFKEVDLDLFYKNLANQVGVNLDMVYMIPKLETWFSKNFVNIAKKSKK